MIVACEWVLERWHTKAGMVEHRDASRCRCCDRAGAAGSPHDQRGDTGVGNSPSQLWRLIREGTVSNAATEKDQILIRRGDLLGHRRHRNRTSWAMSGPSRAVASVIEKGKRMMQHEHEGHTTPGEEHPASQRPRRRRRAKRWSRSLGPYGSRIRVFTLRGGQGGYRKVSLRHRNRERAVAWAKKQLARLLAGVELAQDRTPTVRRVFTAYLMHKTPRKGPSAQQHDRRCAAMWTQVLGATKDLRHLSLGEWEEFIVARRSGEVDATGKRRPEGSQHPVRDRTVQADLQWVTSVLTWATPWQDREGHSLLHEHPARGYPMPRERNPRRPVATQDRYDTVQAVADQVPMAIRWAGTRRRQRSYLRELLAIVNGTGRRISAVRQLRYEDLQFALGPHGAICWPADTDKMGTEWTVPIGPAVRRAMDRVLAERPGIGSAYLFPSPQTPTRPVSKELASRWLRAAERRAGLTPQPGSLWHAYRRKWVTERKHLPDCDVAAAGGWTDLRTLTSAYQQVDAATLYRVVTEPTPLREQTG